MISGSLTHSSSTILSILFLTEEGVQPQGHKRGINLGCGVGCRPEMMGRFPKSESRALSMDKVTEVVRCRLYSEDSKQNLVTYDSLFKKAENMCMSESKRNCILKKLPWSRGLSSLSFLNTLPWLQSSWLPCCPGQAQHCPASTTWHLLFCFSWMLFSPPPTFPNPLPRT